MDNSVENQKRKIFYAISLGFELGFFIVAPLVIFLLLGLFLDKKFHAAPIFLISFVILSLVATFLEIRLLMLPFLEKKVGKNNSQN